MGHTFCNILVHVIFSTKDRLSTIEEGFRQGMYAYMAGIARKEFGFAKKIGGTCNHVHALLQIKADVSTAWAVNRLKCLSSAWVHKGNPALGSFAWQEGYGAFGVSPSAVSQVAGYIERQEAHHRKMTFEEEFVLFLKRHGVEYAPAHVFD